MVGSSKVPMMTSVRKTAGLAFNELLIWLSICIAGGSVASKFVPVYLDHQTAISIMEDLAQDPGMDRLDQRKLQSVIERRFKANNLHDFVKEKRFELRAVSGRSGVALEYEIRGDLAVNIDYVIVFDDIIQLSD
jgi:hypothetical protein